MLDVVSAVAAQARRSHVVVIKTIIPPLRHARGTEACFRQYLSSHLPVFKSVGPAVGKIKLETKSENETRAAAENTGSRLPCVVVKRSN